MERRRGAGKLRPLHKRGSLSSDLPCSLGYGWYRGTARGEVRKGRGTARVEATEQAAGVRFAGGSRKEASPWSPNGEEEDGVCGLRWKKTRGGFSKN